MNRANKRRNASAPENCGEAGFTLMETLVAFMLIAISLPIIYQAWSQTTTGVTRIEQRRQAMALAASVIERVGRDRPAVAGMTTGDDGAGSGLVWRLTITPYAYRETAEASAGVLRVEVVVENRNGARLAQLSTARLRDGSW